MNTEHARSGGHLLLCRSRKACFCRRHRRPSSRAFPAGCDETCCHRGVDPMNIKHLDVLRTLLATGSTIAAAKAMG
ncbi:hypothetical protein CN109_33275, partial [Sinorhizobium meliloti]